MKRTLINLWNRPRTLKIDILTFFLTLICISFLSVISFTRSRDYQTILEFSKEVAEQSSAIVSQKFQDIALASERVARIAAGFFPDLVPFTLQNEPMLAYLSSVIKYNKNFSNFYIGLVNGGFIGVLSLEFADQKNYITDPLKPLPEGAAFMLRFVDLSVSPSTDTWYYLNNEFKQVGQEKIKSLNYDSRLRPWYDGAVKAHSLFWTGFYSFLPDTERGISIGNPIYAHSTAQAGNSTLLKPSAKSVDHKKGDLIGVIGIDLTMEFLDNFVANQKVGAHGKVFITDNTGNIIVPTPARISSKTDSEIVSALFRRHSNNMPSPDIITKYQGIEYLSYISKLPEVFGGDWYIMAIAPADDFFAGLIIVQKQVLLFIIGILFLSAFVVIYFAKKVSSPIRKLASEVDNIRQLELQSETRILSKINEIRQINTAIASIRRVIKSFCKYLPKEIVKDLIDNREEITLGGKKKKVSIFVSDINNFTSIAEALPIDLLTNLLGEYFDVMSKIILESHGTIDKFIGDGILAFWGAPIELKDHVQRACITSLRCLAAISSLNAIRRASQLPEFQTRFGINTGTVIVGNIGTDERMNYTAVGNAAYVANRLQTESKLYHTSIIIGQETYETLGSNFVVRPLDVIVLKENKGKTLIYELAGVIEGEQEIQADLKKKKLCQAFAAAFEAIQEKDLDRAYNLFSEIAKEHPDDYPTQIYLKRIEEGRGK